MIVLVVVLAAIAALINRTPSYAPYAPDPMFPRRDGHFAEYSQVIQDLAHADGESYDAVRTKWYATGH